MESVSFILLRWVLELPQVMDYRRLVLLQNCIVIVISKKGFEAHIDPLFKNLMILIEESLS